MLDRGVARPGDAIAGGGVVTSGTYSPSLERGIGMAYVPSARSQPGTAIEVDVRGRAREGLIATRPLLDR